LCDLLGCAPAAERDLLVLLGAPFRAVWPIHRRVYDAGKNTIDSDVMMGQIGRGRCRGRPQ